MRSVARGCRWLAVLVVACVVLVPDGLGLGNARADEAPVLAGFEQVPATAPAAPQADPAVVRQRLITIDFAALPGPLPPGPLSREPSLPLELFPDVPIVAVFDRYDPNPTGITWVGHVDRVPRSSVSLVYGGGLMAGHVNMPGGVYSIRPAPGAIQAANPDPTRVVHVVSEINQAALPREAPPIAVSLTPDEIAAAEARPATDSDQVIDLMVLYTPLAELVSGGPSGIANLINLGVSDTNTTFANSNITTRIRLVHSQRVDYDEVSSFSTNLATLRASAGALAGVGALRDQHNADLVKLLVHPPSPSACGVAYVMAFVSTGFAPNAFSVTDTQCVSNLTFAHEIGHNMGAQHDWYVSATPFPFTWAHGYADPTPGQRWRTVMSYNDLCSEQGFNCTRTLHWSNPDLNFVPWCVSFDCTKLKYWFFPGGRLGVPGGTDASCREGDPTSTRCDADNARTLNTTKSVVANFRQGGTDPRAADVGDGDERAGGGRAGGRDWMRGRARR